MTQTEKKGLMAHVGHEITLSDYRTGEPDKDTDWNEGRYTLECLDCGQIILGERSMVAV